MRAVEQVFRDALAVLYALPRAAHFSRRPEVMLCVGV